MKRFLQRFFSWQVIIYSTLIPLLALLCSLLVIEFRPFALFIGLIVSFVHLISFFWIWREYMYGTENFDSDDSYAPSGMSKGFFMFGSFIVLSLLSLAMIIIQKEGSLSVIFNDV